MERVSLGGQIELSRIIYGLWRLGDDADRSPAHVQAKLEACLAQGITSFDQADIYGNYESELVLGGALKAAPHLRGKMEIITKCDIMLISDKYPGRRVKHYDTSAAHIAMSIDRSLKLMEIETIDCLLIHRPDPLMDHEETGKALDAAVKSGKVKSVGVSNFKPHDWHLLQSAMTSKLVTNQIEVSLISAEAFTNGDLAFLQQHDVRPMAWSPLGGGSLFQAGGHSGLRDCLKRIAKEQAADEAAVAVAWLLKHPAKILPILGTNAMARIAALADSTRVEMDRETWFELYGHALGHEVP